MTMKKLQTFRPIHQGLLTGGMLIGSAALGLAQDTNAVSALEQENQDLKARVTALEALAQKEGLMPSGAPAPKLVSSLSDMTISGFVQASYFYNTERPAAGYNAGYLWNTKNAEFAINKVKITLASPPAERSDTDWTAGYRVSLMAGEDAPVLNSGSSTTGFDYLREAYVDMNVPIGKGLNIKAGELISLLNWESGDGGAANPNFSQGYQWFYTGNGPSAGVQLDYAFTDWLDVKFRVDNGLYAGPVDGNQGKAVMGSINLTPTKDLWVNFIGFGGDGTATMNVDGASAIGGYQVTSALGTGFEADYFNFEPDGAPQGDLWSLGGWIWYDFTSKVGVAFRAEYLDDANGMGIKGVGLPFSYPAADTAIGFGSPQPNGDLESFTATLNLKPAPNLKIQPEIRYNHTSYTGGFNGMNHQFIIGCGASYLF